MLTDINNLKIESASSEDWAKMLDIVHNANYSYWLKGDEDFKDYFVIKDNNDIIICFFAIICEKSIGILKHFIVTKALQGRGLGRQIANFTINHAAQKIGLEKIYLLADSKEPYTSYFFWKKTNFIEIKDLNHFENSFYQQYIDQDANDHPDYEETRKGFYLHIN